jgi:hypothetical protein
MAHETKTLRSSLVPIRFGNGTTVAGLAGVGSVRQRVTPPGRLRSANLPSELDTSPQFDQALRELGIVEQETLELEAQSVDAGSVGAVTITPSIAVQPGQSRVVLYQDESGGVSWHFAAPAMPGTRPGLRSGRRAGPQTFTIPLRHASVQRTLSEGNPRRSLRGPITKIGRKIFKIFVLPVLSKMLEDPVRWFAEKVEARYRPNLIWDVSPENYTHKPAVPVTDWGRLRNGPTLLIVHGIFSSVEGMLSSLPRAAMEDWHKRYQGRVIAFNHPSVSASPEDNARYFLNELHRAAPFQRFVFDILCHSRGGIVSRALAERAVELVGPNACSIRSVYFVATPNAGSPLGDPAHMVDMIDTFTNCLTSFPDGPVTYSMEVIVALVSLVGNTGIQALPGIAALGTHDSYVTDTLNRGTERPRAFYAAAGSDFEPKAGRDNGWLIDKLANPVMDKVFVYGGKRVANDIVVPQQGVFAANGHPAFPIADPLVYAPGDGVWHTAFFAQPRTIEHITLHLDRVDRAAGAAASARFELPSAPNAPPSPRLRSSPRAAPEVTLAEPTVDDAFTEENLDMLSVEAGDASPRGGLRRSGSGASGPAPVVPKAAARKRALKKPEATTAETTTRDPQIRFHERIQAGSTEPLEVILKLPAGGAAPAGLMQLVFDAGQDEVELTAEVSAPGFSVVSPRHASLRILRVRDPKLERATFWLKAQDPGSGPVERAIDVTFWRGNDCVGGVTHHTVVVPAGYIGTITNSPDSSSAVHLSNRPRDTADLVLYLKRHEKGKDVFDLDLRCSILGEEYETRSFGVLDLGGKLLSEYVAEAIDPSFDSFPRDGLSDKAFEAALAQWNGDFITTLRDFGQQLWMLLPEAFRTEYLRLAALDNPPRSLFVFSDEFAFPWEVVRPSGLIRNDYCELPPLGISHILGRWKPGTGALPNPQAMKVSDMALLMPDSSGLPWALKEAAELAALVPQAKNIQPLRRKELDALLSQDAVQVVHFSGHGDVGANADLTHLELEGGEKITAMAFAASKLGKVAHPVLYLNACTVGRSASLLGRAGGFAGNCIESGWSGVVAPYWPVYDSSASEFGVSFYKKLKAGRSVGEALQELRSERQADPTAQAYAYFGDPFARLQLLT